MLHLEHRARADAERTPRRRADDAVGGEAVAALEGDDGAPRAGPEDAVGGDVELALEEPDRAVHPPRAPWWLPPWARRRAAIVAGPGIAVDREAVAGLEALDRALGLRAVDPVDGRGRAGAGSRGRARARDLRLVAAAAGARVCVRASARGAWPAPATPSAVRWWRRWKRLTARSVPVPKTPSALRCRRRWRRTTRGPRLPFLSGLAAAGAARRRGGGGRRRRRT